jgi:hypothetical protein
VTLTGLFFLLAGWVATTTRQSTLSGPTGTPGEAHETAYDLTLRARLELVWREMETRLNEGMIKHRVLFAAGHKGEARQVGEHSPSAILSIEPEQGAFSWELVRRKARR